MSRSTVIIISSFLIILIPFLGFPRSWEPGIIFFLASVIILVELYAVLSRAQEAFFLDHEIVNDVYTEKVQKRKEESGFNEKETEDQ